jgi:hypothetical protein
MSRILSAPAAGQVPVGSVSWTVSGALYDNAAVKFWSALLDEVAEDFAGADAFSLEGSCDDFLVPEMLEPAALFSEELDTLEDEEEMDATLQELAQELDLLGSPPLVKAKVFAGEQSLCSCDLPEEVIDSELLPLFLVWPLEWAGLSEFGWNRRDIHGGFTALDAARGLTYDVRFHLENAHIREGLFHRRMILRFARKAA